MEGPFQCWLVLSFKKKPIQASALILGFEITTQGIEYLAFETK